MNALIPAAGYATRLRPLTEHKPKALLDVGGRAILDHIVDRLVPVEGVDEIGIVTNDLFYDSFCEWASGRDDIFIHVVNDGSRSNEDRLGSMGDIDLGLRKLDFVDDFLVVNSDNLFSFGLEGFVSRFRERGNLLGLYDVGDRAVASRKGQPVLDSSQMIVDFREKDPNPLSTVCSTGIYAFQRPVRYLIEQYCSARENIDTVGDFVSWLARVQPVFGYEFPREEGVMFDIGTLDSYVAAQVSWEALQKHS